VTFLRDSFRDFRPASIDSIKRQSEGGTAHAFGRLSIVLSLIDVARLQGLTENAGAENAGGRVVESEISMTISAHGMGFNFQAIYMQRIIFNTP